MRCVIDLKYTREMINGVIEIGETKYDPDLVDVSLLEIAVELMED